MVLHPDRSIRSKIVPLGKQAKPLTKAQVEAVLGYLAKTRHPIRNRLIFLLSIRAGLRAREIALLTWSMVTDAESKIGGAIALQDEVSKGQSGRIIPIHSQLRAALIEWREIQQPFSDSRIIRTERSKQTSPQTVVNMFARWYEQIGFDGCSSHSGRRTFITNAARKISLVGGSLRDVQMLAGHTSLRVTQRYIDADQDAQRKIVELI
jgi:integrase/recombinase XerD